jgi:hypothetical protein
LLLLGVGLISFPTIFTSLLQSTDWYRNGPRIKPASLPPPLSAARKKRKSKYIPEEIAKTDPFMGKHDYADENMYTFFIDTYLSLSLIIN